MIRWMGHPIWMLICWLVRSLQYRSRALTALDLRCVQELGGAGLGDRTMIDALAPALNGLIDNLAVATSKARAGADSTAQMHEAKAGRAAYVNATQLKGHIDPGGDAVARLFERLLNASMPS